MGGERGGEAERGGGDPGGKKKGGGEQIGQDRLLSRLFGGRDLLPLDLMQHNCDKVLLIRICADYR